MGWLAVCNSLLDSFNITVQMAISDKDVRPAVEVIVEEKTCEAQRKQRGASDRRAWGFVYKQAVTLVVIKRHHLVRKITDNDAGPAGAIVVRGVNSHSGARHSIFAEGNTRGYCLLGEGPVAV